MKVGDYVRTKDGYITKLIEIRPYLEDGETIETEIYDFDKNIDGYNNGVDCDYAKEIIVKSSPNIIDLIEVGDYVNGWKITTVDKRNHKLYAEYDDGYLIQTISKKNIKSIVTKEQFESMKYMIGE